MNRHTVFVCEAEPAAMAGVRWFLTEAREFELVGSAQSISTGVTGVAETRPDILLLDHASGMRATISILSEVRYLSERTHCLLWTREVPETELVKAFQAGAKGFVMKASPLSVLLEAMHAIARGETYIEDGASPALRQWTTRQNVLRLTPREREIIDLVSMGLKNREIAERLQITPGTVKVHLMHVFEKTGARDRYELAISGARLLQGVSELPRTKTA